MVLFSARSDDCSHDLREDERMMHCERDRVRITVIFAIRLFRTIRSICRVLSSCWPAWERGHVDADGTFV